MKPCLSGFYRLIQQLEWGFIASEFQYIRAAMKKLHYILIACILYSASSTAQNRRFNEPRTNVPLDSIVLSDPFILADKKTNMYYMTGTGGLLWKSRDMRL